MGVAASRTEEYSATDDADPDQVDGTDNASRIDADDRKDSTLIDLTSTEFSWRFGGNRVSVTGAWDDWHAKSNLEMVSASDWGTVLALPPGTFQYKFIVDGNWKHNPALPTERDQHGNLNNVVTVKAEVSQYELTSQFMEDQLSTSPMESYDYSILPQEDHTTEPPALPRLLASAPLDRLTDSASSSTEFVRFNHMFATNCDAAYGTSEIRTIASELRYKSKVITTILITPKSKVQPQPHRRNRTQQIPVRNRPMMAVQPMGESQSLILDALNNV